MNSAGLWAFWTSTHASALPIPELARLWMWLGWGIVLATLLLAASAAWTSRQGKPARYAVLPWLAALIVLWCGLPGALSPAYWLGLTFQSPSVLTVVLCLFCLVQHLTGTAKQETTPGCRPRLHIIGTTALGLGLGWILLLDTLALLPVQFYVLGWSPAAVTITLLVCALLTLPAWHEGGTPIERWALPLTLLLFVALRLPSGNLWDALLDPCLWIALHGYALRGLLRWRRSGKSATDQKKRPRRLRDRLP